MKTNVKVLRSFVAMLLVLTMLPASIVMGITPDDVNRKDSGDISSVIEVNDSNSSITVKKSDGTVISPDSGNNYTNVPDDASITIHYEFSLPDNNGKDSLDSGYKEYSYLAGDTYTVSLPNGLQYKGIPKSGEPLYTDALKTTPIGTLAIDAGGIATITFNDYVEKQSNITGWFQIAGTFKQDNIDNGTPIVIQFESKSVTVTPQVPAVTLDLKKSGTYAADANQITWTVVVTPPDGKSVSNVSLEDVYGSNQNYVNDSFTLNTTSIPDSELTLNSAGNKITYSFLGAISGAQTITYKTSPIAGAFSAEKGSTVSSSYKNTATLKKNGVQNGTSKTSTVTLDWISKNAGAYSDSTKKIAWTVQTGIAGQTISGAVIQDTLPANVTLNTDSVTWKDSGTAAAVTQDTAHPDSPESGKFGYNSSSRTLIYNAGTLTGRGTLAYTTTVPNTQLDNVNDSITYVNSALLTWDKEGNSSVNAPSVSASKTITSGGLISKSAGSTMNYDHTNPIIHWKITVNRSQVDISSGTKIEDTINAGQKFLPGTLKYNGVSVSPDSYTDSSFSYTFSSAFSNTRTITYDTQITDETSLYKNSAGVYFGNNVKLIKDGTEYSASGTQQFSSEIINKSIQTDYNYNTHELTWKIAVNRNKLPMTNAKVTDTIPDGMSYVADSLTVDGAAAQPDGGSADSSVSYTFSGPISEQHIITLRTKMTNEKLKTPFGTTPFTNSASLEANEIASPVIASASKNIGNPIVAKTADYTTGNDYIDWKVEVNKAQLSLDAGITLTDDLVSVLSLNTDTVRIYPATVNPADGTLAPGPNPISSDQYTVQYNTDALHPNRVTFKFLNAINSAYLVEFSTDVLSSTAAISNTVVLDGVWAGTIPSASASQVQVNSITAGGGGSTGSISIHKTDAEGNNLSGAKFELLNIAGVKIAEQTTGASGTAQFSSLQYRTFYIRETHAPSGYLLNPAKQRVRLSSATPAYLYTVQNQKALGTVSFQKTSAGGTLLSGGSFRLTGTDSLGNAVSKTASSLGGTVSFQNVPLGSGYEIREVTPPSGFVKTNTVLTASVQYNNDQTAVVTSVSANTLTNDLALGTVSFQKTSAGGALLSGGSFRLTGTDSLGNAVSKTASSLSGTVSFQNVPLGSGYEIREVTPPDGYQKTNTVLTASVQYNNDQTAVITSVSQNTLANSPALGTVSFRKTSSGGALLSGGSFRLTGTDSFGNMVSKTAPSSGGTVSFQNVPLGSGYEIREVTPPDGYLKTNTALTASVQYNNDQTAVVTNVSSNTLTNDPALGTVSFQKTSTGGALLSGGSFRLTGTDSLGNAVSMTASASGGTVSFQNVPLGDSYTISEVTPPSGFEKTNTVLTASVKYNSDKTAVVTNVSQNTLTNAQTPHSSGSGGSGGGTIPTVRSYSISVTKTDESGKRLAGAQFTLYGTSGTTLSTGVSDSKGVAVFDNLAEGSYTIRETKAPDGFELNSQSSAATVNDSTANQFTVVDRAVASTGTVQIKKTDENGHALSGAGFTLYDANGTQVAGASTGSDGFAVLKNLPQGQYTIYETHVPKGYAAGTPDTTVTVKAGKTTALTITNRKIAENTGDIKVKKADINGAALSGAEFTLYDADGKAVQKAISGLDGLVEFAGLAPGSYSLHETAAPAGYKLFKEALSVTLEAGQQFSYTLRDEREGDKSRAVLGWTDNGSLPKTGGIPVAAIAFAIGALLILAGIGIRKVRWSTAKHALQK